MNKKAISFLLIVSFIMLAGCDLMATMLHGEKPIDTSVAVTGVSLSPKETSVVVNRTVTLIPSITPGNATNKNVTWESNRTSVATVTNGVVTGVSDGTAVITVTTKDGGYKDTCSVTVTAGVVLVTGVSLVPRSTTLSVGQTTELTVNFTPVNPTNKNVTWESSRESVATVTNGVVMGVAEGSAIITVTTIDGGHKDTCTVTVSAATSNVSFTNLTANGSPSVTTTQLTLQFSAPITGLSANDIQLSGVEGVTKGTLTGNNPYTLAISGVTSSGNLTVSVQKTGFNFDIYSKTVMIYAEVTPATLAAYLGTLSISTPSTPHNISLKVSYNWEFYTIGDALKSAPTKYVSLDLTGSTATSIEEGALSGCASLTGIKIPDSVTSIKNWAFSESANFTSVTIPNTVTSIGEGAFYKTTLGSVTIPNGITRIENSTFQNCSFTSVNIPNSVTSIGDYAFHQCARLANVNISNNVTSIGEGAFDGCANLPSVTIPNSVIRIDQGAFNFCNILNSVEFRGGIPSSGFSENWVFPGDLREKFYESNPDNGTPGTYTRAPYAPTWNR